MCLAAENVMCVSDGKALGHGRDTNVWRFGMVVLIFYGPFIGDNVTNGSRHNVSSKGLNCAWLEDKSITT